MSYVSIIADIPDRNIATLRAALDKTGKRESVRAILDELHGVLGGVRKGHLRAVLASARASTTVTCDQSAAVDGTDDITIAGTTISVEAAPATEDEMDSGTTDAEFADNLAAAINAHSTLQKSVFAVSDGVDTVTVYCVFPGPIGNLIALAETGSGFTLGAANLASGASDEVDSYAFGYDPATA